MYYVCTYIMYGKVKFFFSHTHTLGEAFGKGETAFSCICKKRTLNGQIFTTNDQSTENMPPEELGLENAAYDKST